MRWIRSLTCSHCVPGFGLGTEGETPERDEEGEEGEEDAHTRSQMMSRSSFLPTAKTRVFASSDQKRDSPNTKAHIKIKVQHVFTEHVLNMFSAFSQCTSNPSIAMLLVSITIPAWKGEEKTDFRLVGPPPPLFLCLPWS